MPFLTKHVSIDRLLEYSEKNTVSFVLLLNVSISIPSHAEDKIRSNCRD